MQNDLERDFVGYGRRPPKIEWPRQARVVLNFVVNYEEGAERNIPDGYPTSDPFGEIHYALPEGMRDLAAESSYEFGSRSGVWRLLRIFAKHGIHVTFYACGLALERNPELGPALAELGHEPCSHGYRFGEHYLMTEMEERMEIRAAIAAIRRCVGERPVGWYCRYGPSERTRQLLLEEGGFIYDSLAYNDELPYYVRVQGHPWLVIPYAADTNDAGYRSKFATPEHFYQYLVAAFKQHYEEGAETPKMMSIGLHSVISGRAARATAIDRFISFAKEHDRVWWARRDEIARFWLENYPPVPE
jgi:peptidoglycan/xylan/chitin deacetylase (PgdA/CDA1 family)